VCDNHLQQQNERKKKKPTHPQLIRAFHRLVSLRLFIPGQSISARSDGYFVTSVVVVGTCVLVYSLVQRRVRVRVQIDVRPQQRCSSLHSCTKMDLLVIVSFVLALRKEQHKKNVT
jgi:hypothetical protein